MHFKIDPNSSYYEFTSVGRLYVNIAKLSKPNRWPHLLITSEEQKKYNNLHTWWELYEKYQGELIGYANPNDYEDYKLDQEEQLKQIREREKKLLGDIKTKNLKVRILERITAVEGREEKGGVI